MKRISIPRRMTAFFLCLCLVASALPALADSIEDTGSNTAKISQVFRHNYLKNSSGGTVSGAYWEHITEKGIQGPAFCINWGLAAQTQKWLEIKYRGVDAKTQGAFASGYPQVTLAEFLMDNAHVSGLAGLTVDEFAYATQIAVWATLGQLGIAGTSFTSGRITIPQPTNNTQEMRTFKAVQIILAQAETWRNSQYRGMSIRYEHEENVREIEIVHQEGLERAAQENQSGLQKEIINGTEYYTIPFIASTATTPKPDGYKNGVILREGPAGAIVTDMNNNTLPMTTFTTGDNRTYDVYLTDGSRYRETPLNANGVEWYSEAKLCIPVDGVTPSGYVDIRCTAICKQYELYLAYNPTSTEQSYIIADPSEVRVWGTGYFRWRSEETEKGALEVIKTDGTGNPLLGAEFVLDASDGQTVQPANANGDRTVFENLDPALTYTLRETKAPDGYTPITPYKVTVQANRTTYETVRNNNQAVFRLKKTDAQNGYSLQGVTFRFEQIDGSFVTEAKTEHDGQIIFTAKQLPFGSYKVYEISTIDGYILDSTPKTVHWDGSADVTLHFENVRKPTLVIIKNGEYGQSLPGAVFNVYRNGALITTVTTNDSGIAYVTGLSTGYYEIEEITAPPGYVLDSTKKGVYIDAYDPATQDDPVLIVTNKAKPSLRILKYDVQTMRPIPDTTFEVYRDASLIGAYRTDENGEIFLYDLEPGTYLVKEVSANPGYVVNSTPREIEVEAGANKTYSLIFLNFLKPGIHLVKLDSESMEPLVNAVFLIQKIGGAFSKEYTTDRNGEIDLTGLEPGAYSVREIQAPDGYLVDDAVRTIQINPGESAMFVFTDSKKPSMELVKVDADGKGLAGAVFRISKIEDGSRYLDRVSGTDGKILIENLEPGIYSVLELSAPEGYVRDDTEYHVELFPGKTSRIVISNLKKPDLKIIKTDAVTGKPIADVTFTVRKADGATVSTVTTNTNGEALLKNLDPGVYQVTEQSVPAGYILDTTPQLITLEPGRMGVVRFQNYPKLGLRIVKLDADTLEPIQNAVFEICHVSGERVGTYRTDKSGVIHLSLPGGAYTVVEKSVPSPYILDATQHIVIIKDGELAELEVTNRRAASILIRKVDSITGKGIYGVSFLLYDSGNNPIGQYTSDQSGYVWIDRELIPGKYLLRELQAASGYILDEQPKTVYVEAGRTTEIRWANTPVQGQIQIIKKSADDNTRNGLSKGTLLPGAVFEIRDRAGNLVDTVTSGNDGRAVSMALPLGRYTVREVQAPDNYKLNDTIYDIELEHAGQIIRLEVLNESVKLGVSVEKKGYYEVVPGQQIRYDFSSIGNTSNVPLASFYWRDTLPVDAVRLNKLVTGTWNQELSYKVIYKTNLSGDYRVLADNISTRKSYTLDASPAALRLAANEYVTEIMFVFGTVRAGFAQVEAPRIYCDVLSGLPHEYRFVNNTDVGGLYGGIWVMAVDRWVTVVYGKTPPKTLPKTGN